MKPKVAFVIQSLELGGAQKVVAELLNSAVLRDAFDLHLIQLIEGNAYPVSPQIIHHRGNFPKNKTIVGRLRNTLSKVRFIKETVDREQFDVVVSHMTTSNLLLLMARPRARTCIVEHNVPFKRANWTGVFVLLAKILYRRADAAIFISREVLKSWSVARLPIRSSVIYNPLNVSEVVMKSGIPITKVQLPERFILGVGRLVYAKGFDLLIKAFEQVKDEELSLVIIGDGPERENLSRQAVRSSKSGKIIFIHDEHNPFPYMKVCSCFVLPSRWEGLPLVLIEALICRCKIVSFSCVSGPSEVLKGGELGRVVTSGDIDALAAEIDAVVLDNSQINEEQIIKHLQLFDPSKIAGEYRDEIISLLGK